LSQIWMVSLGASFVSALSRLQKCSCRHRQQEKVEFRISKRQFLVGFPFINKVSLSDLFKSHQKRRKKRESDILMNWFGAWVVHPEGGKSVSSEIMVIFGNIWDIIFGKMPIGHISYIRFVCQRTLETTGESHQLKLYQISRNS